MAINGVQQQQPLFIQQWIAKIKKNDEGFTPEQVERRIQFVNKNAQEYAQQPVQQQQSIFSQQPVQQGQQSKAANDSFSKSDDIDDTDTKSKTITSKDDEDIEDLPVNNNTDTATTKKTDDTTDTNTDTATTKKTDDTTDNKAVTNNANTDSLDKDPNINAKMLKLFDKNNDNKLDSEEKARLTKIEDTNKDGNVDDSEIKNAKNVLTMLDVSNYNLEHSDKDYNFIQEVWKGISSLPENVTKKLLGVNYKVKIGNTMTEADPSLKGGEPFGAGTTWDNATGASQYSENAAVIAENYIDSSGNKQTNTKAAGATLHEIGHYFGYANSNQDSDGFTSAYDKDLNGSAPKSSSFGSSGFYSNYGLSSKVEAFAEAFRMAVDPNSKGPANSNGNNTNENTTDYIKKNILSQIA